MSDKTIDRLTERATPGPWRIEDGCAIVGHWEDSEAIQICSLNMPTWSVDSRYDNVELNRQRNARVNRERPANARLIAAAPELLEACKFTAAKIDLYQNRGTKSDREALDRAEIMLRAAIRKTEGQP